MSALIVIEGKVFYLSCFLGIGEVFLKFVYRANLHANIWFFAQLFRVFTKNIACVFGFDKHFKRFLFGVYHHIICVTFIHILLKLGVCGLLFYASCHHVASSCEEEKPQRNDYQPINPVHIKAGHLGLFIVVRLFITHNSIVGDTNILSNVVPILIYVSEVGEFCVGP